jgi:hypothetical protein
MKDRDKIQHAHDLLVQIITDQVPIIHLVAPRLQSYAPTMPLSETETQMRIELANYAEVICWFLEHEYNPTFPKNMEHFLIDLRADARDREKLQHFYIKHPDPEKSKVASAHLFHDLLQAFYNDEFHATADEKSRSMMFRNGITLAWILDLKSGDIFELLLEFIKGKAREAGFFTHDLGKPFDPNSEEFKKRLTEVSAEFEQSIKAAADSFVRGRNQNVRFN